MPRSVYKMDWPVQTGVDVKIRTLGVCVLLTGLLPGLGASAETLDQALAEAYLNNPQLQAARAGQRAAQKNVAAAKGGWYPKLALTASMSRDNTSGQITLFPVPPFSATLNQSSIGVRLDQPIWQGGTLSANVNAAEDKASAQHAMTRAQESRVLLQAVRAYLEVVTAHTVLEVQVHNVQTLERQLDAAQQSLNHGEGTRTDVAQAKARYEGAIAARIQAQAALARAQADYTTVIGHAPTPPLALPKRVPALPATLQQAESLAGQNFNVTAARFTAEAAHAEADGTYGKLLPKVGLYAEVVRNRNPQYGFARVDDRIVGIQVSVPIWQGGTVHEEAAAARERAREAEMNTRATGDQARNQAVAAWQNYLAARSTVSSLESQLDAARIAYEGIKDEHQHGLRTLTDVLNALQDMRNAHVALVRAQRERIVAAYSLLAATGGLTARSLELPVRGKTRGG